MAESGSNFLLFGGHFDKREAIFDELLKRGVLIRVVGPDGWLRVCMGTDEEMETLRKADKNCRLIKGQVFLWPGATSWHGLWDEDGTITQ